MAAQLDVQSMMRSYRKEKLRLFAETLWLTKSGKKKNLFGFCQLPRTADEVACEFRWDAKSVRRLCKALQADQLLEETGNSQWKKIPTTPSVIARDLFEWIDLGSRQLEKIRDLSDVQATRVGLTALPSLCRFDLSDQDIVFSLWY